MVGRNGTAPLLVKWALAALVAIAAPAQAAGPVTLLFLGDSLGAGFGLQPGQSIPDRLGARLGASVAIVNVSVSGDTTAGGLARLDDAIARHPDAALIELGANDALRGFDPKMTFANLDAILTRLEAARIKVALLGMRAPGNWGAQYQRDFDAIYPRLAEKHRAPLYPFVLEGVALDPALNQGDGIHPNARGADRIAEQLAPFVADFLKR